MMKLKWVFTLIVIFSLGACTETTNPKESKIQTQDSILLVTVNKSIIYPMDSVFNNQYWKTVYFRNHFIGKSIDSLIELLQPKTFRLETGKNQSKYSYATFKEFNYQFQYITKDNRITNILTSPSWNIKQDSSGVFQKYCNQTFSRIEFDSVLKKHQLENPDTLKSKYPFRGKLIHFIQGNFTLWIDKNQDSITIKRVGIGKSKALPFFNDKHFQPSDIHKLPPPPFQSEPETKEPVNTFYPHLREVNEPHVMHPLPNTIWRPRSEQNNYLMNRVYHVNDSLDKLHYKNLKDVTIKGGDQVNRSHLVSTNFSADVMTLENCENMVFENLIFGHYVESQCMGNTITLINCKNITFKNCVIYGSGIIGIKADKCKGLKLENVGVYDCELTGVQLGRCENTFIYKSRFYESKSCYISALSSINTQINNTQFDKMDKSVYPAIYAPPVYTENDSIYHVILKDCIANDYTQKSFSKGMEPEGDDTTGMDLVIRNNLKFIQSPKPVYNDCGTE